jgi:hypothetical protein
MDRNFLSSRKTGKSKEAEADFISLKWGKARKQAEFA